MGATSKVLSDKGQAKPTADLGRQAVEEISTQLRQLLADVFAHYLKIKNFHWHMAGRHFRDYHLLLEPL
jgi:starvation-inducible DNA-binding protein